MFRALLFKQLQPAMGGMDLREEGWTWNKLTPPQCGCTEEYLCGSASIRAAGVSFTSETVGTPYWGETDMPGRHQVMARPTHSEHVLQQLNNQREWGFLCDCSIAVGDVDFRAHKAVLAACSSYFRMMFIKDQRGRLELSNMPVSAECFDLILQLMYLGRTATEPSDFEELKVAMAYLQMYYVPDSLEDLRGNRSANGNPVPPSSSSSSSSFSSSSSSSPSSAPAEAKIMFGVRLYEQPKQSSTEGDRVLQQVPPATAPAPVLLGPTPLPQGVSRPPTEEAVAKPLMPTLVHVDALTERPCDPRKRPPGRRAATRERPRFGRTFTCDDCGFVFSCEKLLVEHGLTCTNRKAFQSPEAHRAPGWGEISVYEAPEGQEWREGGDWRERGTDPSMEAAIRSVGTGTDSRSARNGIAIKVELEEISTMDGVTTVQVGESTEDGDAPSPRCQDSTRDRRPFNRGDEEAGVSSVEEGGTFEGPDVEMGTWRIKEEGQGSACMPCELCGTPLDEEDRSAHYISSHMAHICACGRCGQIFVRGRQLQEHAEHCGESRDTATKGSPGAQDGQGRGAGEEGLRLESEETAARHVARHPERAGEGSGRSHRQRHGKGLYERSGQREPRYSRRLLRDRQLRPNTSLVRDAPRHCSPGPSATGTPSSSTTTCAT
ncbi:hypothetical protein AAFF_G00240710 [Aldrovandia affinis]|uniref:Uncharacterized protein n=1 Tax=Aldrovandia affinis TaxID=143900 RepID=A0AAD7WU34_9TELE|nr:hypothetical protein AAFF_G00240710 [Aldrovandia affinis]